MDFHFLVLQKIKFLLKPSPEWGPAHKVPKFDLQDVEREKGQRNIENPNFSSSDSVTKIWTGELYVNSCDTRVNEKLC